MSAVAESIADGLKPEALARFCRRIAFAPGDVLRQQGQHYRDMYWITDGMVAVDLGNRAAPLIRQAGSPVGEIGFLRGWPATATVTAVATVEALVIDDPALARLEHEDPAAAAQLLRRLAEVAEARTSDNLAFVSSTASYADADAIAVHLCRTPDMLESAQRLRYEVYCQELKRKSPFADHARKIISDDLDAAGHTFIAVEAGETIGTLRANIPAEGPVGSLADLYGMRRSPHYPAATAVCTKFVVKRSKRGSPAAMKLIGAVVRYGARRDMQECYADSVPALLPYYKALGFKIVAPPFFHRENGPSYPIVLDLVRHGPKLAREFGPRDYIKLYAKAKLLKWLDRSLPRAVDPSGGSVPAS